MFCKNCGKEINDKSSFCGECGTKLDITTENESNNEITPTHKNTLSENDEPKTGIGIVLGLFLGIIGLVIGFCLYKDGTVARKTFIKAWTTTFIISVIIGIIIGVIYYVNITNEINEITNDYNDYLDDLYKNYY